MKTFEQRKLEEFDDIAPADMEINGWNVNLRPAIFPIRDFLKTALQEQKEEILKGLPEIREVLGFSEYAEGQVVGFNQILEEIRKIIKEM